MFVCVCVFLACFLANQARDGGGAHVERVKFEAVVHLLVGTHKARFDWWVYGLDLGFGTSGLGIGV